LREFFLLVPKKNGKSAIAAAIIVVAAIMNERPEAELLLIAPTKEISNIAFKQAAGIIKLDEELNKLFQIIDHVKQIRHRNTLAIIIVKSAAPDVITGSKATFILIDETHVFASMAKAADVFVEIRGSLASRPDGFLLQITTQSKAPPTGVFKSELATARAVRDGDIRLPLLAVLYELPIEVSKDDGWKDPATWPLVNPNLGRSVDEAFLRDEVMKAERDGKEKLALIASQHFNVEIGLALSADRWTGALYWVQNSDREITFERMLDECEVIVAGGDVGGADDLFGFSAIGRHAVSRVWWSWSWAWCLRPVLDLRKSIAPKLLELEALGQLSITDSAEQHVEAAADICVQIRDAGKFPVKAGIGLDPHGVAALVDRLEQDGFEAGRDIVPVGQGYKLTGAIKGLERRLFDGRLKHGGQELMTWCVGNAKAEQRGNNVYVTKEAAGVAKIDPLIALFNAAILMDGNPEAAANLNDFLAAPILVTR
jgi:phage terminase large subunit-like protein